MNKKVLSIFLCMTFILSSLALFSSINSQSTLRSNELFTKNIINTPLDISVINITHPSDLILNGEDSTNHTIFWNLTEIGPFDYLGTYSFTEDAVSANPLGWIIFESPPNNDLGITQVLGNHNKVVELYDNSGSQYTRMTNSFTGQTTGTIEFWFRVSDSIKYVYFQLGEGGVALAQRRVTLEIGGGKLRYNPQPFDICNITNNQWYHVRFSFNCTSDTSSVWVDGVLKKQNHPFENLGTQITHFYINTATPSTGGFFTYVDAIDYSWAPGYHLNRNMDYGSVDYLGVYSFTNDTDGENPADWVINEPVNSLINVMANKDGHRKVLALTNEGVYPTATQIFGSRNPVNGDYLEFWVYGENGTRMDIDIEDTGPGLGSYIWLQLRFYENKLYSIKNAGASSDLLSSNLTAQTWHHLRIRPTGSSSFQIWLDAVILGPPTGTMYSKSTYTRIYFDSKNTGTVYCDAVDYSWVSGYYQNRNMDYTFPSTNLVYAIFVNKTQTMSWQQWISPVQVRYNVSGLQLGFGFHNISLVYNDTEGHWNHDDVIITVEEMKAPNILSITQDPLTPVYQEPVNVTAHIIDDTQIQVAKIETNYSLAVPPYDYIGASSFSADSNGADPMGWMVHEPLNTTLQVIESKETHHKVVEFLCEGSDWDANWIWNDFQSHTTGSVEFWAYIVEIEPLYGGASDATQFFLGLLNSSESGPMFSANSWGPMLGFEAGGTINYNVGNKNLYTIGTWTPDTWQHYRIDFNTATDKFDVYQDGIKIGTQCSFRYGQSAVKRAYIGYGWAESHSVECEVYVDAIDFSWAPGYYTNRSMNYIGQYDLTNYTMTKTSGTFQDGTWDFSFFSYPTNKTIAYRIFASDIYGNTNVSTWFNFKYLDSQGPIITELTQEPIAPGYFEGVNVSVRITDISEIGKVQIETNATGSFIISPMTQLTGTSQDGYWNYFFNGYYWNRTIAYRIIAVDTLENYRVSNWSYFGYFDVIAPIITELTQVPIAPGYLEGVNVTVRIMDNSQIGNVKIETNATGSFTISPMIQLAGTSQDGYWNYFFNSYLLNKTIAYRIIAVDTLENYRISGWSCFEYSDLLCPNIIGLSQNPLNPGYQDPVSISVRITDGTRVASVAIEANQTGAFLIYPMIQWSGTFLDGVWNYTFVNYPLNKFIGYRIIAVDILGNVNATGLLNFGVFDITDPLITNIIQNPAILAQVKPVNITVFISDNFKVSSVKIETNVTSIWANSTMALLSGSTQAGIWTYLFTTYPINYTIAYRIFAIDIVNRTVVSSYSTFGIFPIISWYVPTELEFDVNIRGNRKVDITFEFTNTGNTKWLNLNFTIILPENWTATVYTKSIGQLSAGQKITVTFRVTAPPNVVEKQVYLAYILFETNINETGTEKTGTILVPMTGIEILGVWVWIVIVIGSAAAVMSTSLIVVRKRHAVAAGEQRMKSKSKNYELLKADVFKEFPGTYSVFSPELIERINSLVGLSENEKNLLIEYISQLDEDEAQAWLNEFQNRPMD